MLLLTVVTLFIGVMYLWMGALICFRGHTGLICNYIADEKSGKFDAAYARRVGWIELFSGAACTAAGVAALCIGKSVVSVVLMLGCIIGSLAACRVNYRRSAHTAAKAQSGAQSSQQSNIC